MNKNNKHKLAVVVIFLFAILIGGSASAEGQLPGVFTGILFIYIAQIVVTKWFPEGAKKCSCNELEYTNQYADSWKCKECKKIYLNKEGKDE